MDWRRCHSAYTLPDGKIFFLRTQSGKVGEEASLCLFA